MPDMTAAAFPVSIGDKIYMMSPLTDKDIEELNNWFRADIIRVAQSSLSPELSAAERTEVLDVAIQRAAKFVWYSPNAQDVMGNLSAISRVIWMGMRKNHPNLEVEEVRRAIFDPVNRQAVLDTWKRLNVGEEKKSTGGTPKGKSRRRSRSTPG